MPADPVTASPLPAGLTARQCRYIVLQCRSPEPTRDQIAEHMGIAPKTVDRYRDDVYDKLGISTRVELYFKAVELGLVKCVCALLKERGVMKGGRGWMGGD